MTDGSLSADDHAAAIRRAADALNDALRAAAAAGVGANIWVDYVPSGTPEVEHRITVSPYRRL